MTYPHFSLGQEPGFIGANIESDQLTYEQFLTWELATIMTSKNPTEREGRLEFFANHFPLETVNRWIMDSN